MLENYVEKVILKNVKEISQLYIRVTGGETTVHLGSQGKAEGWC